MVKLAPSARQTSASSYQNSSILMAYPPPGIPPNPTPSPHRFHQRLSQTGLHGLLLRQALAQIGAQAAQLCDAGDDAGLFGEGREHHLGI